MVILTVGVILLTSLVGISLFRTGDSIEITGPSSGFAPSTKSFLFFVLLLVSGAIAWSTFDDWRGHRK